MLHSAQLGGEGSLLAQAQASLGHFIGERRPPNRARHHEFMQLMAANKRGLKADERARTVIWGFNEQERVQFAELLMKFGVRNNDFVPLYKRARHSFGMRTQYEFLLYGARLFEFVFFLESSGLANEPHFLLANRSPKDLELRIADINAVTDLHEMFKDKPGQFVINHDRKFL